MRAEQQRIALTVLWVVYAFGALAFLVLIENATQSEGYFRTQPYGASAGYYSLRYTSMQWVLSLTATFKVLMLVPIALFLLYGGRQQRGCCITWTTVAVVLSSLNAFTLFGLANYYSTCNGVASVDNPCNSKLWCCAPDVYAIAENACNRASPCTGAPEITSSASLHADADFLWLFYVTLVFFIADVLVVVFMSIPLTQSTDKAGGGLGEAEFPPPPPQQPSAPPASKLVGARTVALTRRELAVKWSKGE